MIHIPECITWPMTCYHTFQEAVSDAIRTGLPINISERHIVRLEDSILLKDNDTNLRIIGCNASNSSRPVIESVGHSLIQISGKRSSLYLENLIMHHTRGDSDRKNIGAVVFASSNVTCHINNCEIRSLHGFSIWAVQRAQFIISRSRISSLARSGCVAFGHATLSLEDTTIHDCHQHGICLRGRCQLSMKSCSVVGSGHRGIYGYEHAKILIQDSSVDYTQCSHLAAIEVKGFGTASDDVDSDERKEKELAETECPVNSLRTFRYNDNLRDQPSLVIKNVTFRGNICPPVVVLGPDILLKLENCQCTSSCSSDYVTLGLKDVIRSRSISSSDKKSLCWEYHVDGDDWCPYSEDISNFISLQYEKWLKLKMKHGVGISNILKQDGTTTCKVIDTSETSGEIEHAMWRCRLPSPLDVYEVDLMNFNQSNTITHFSRRIRKK